MALRFIALGLCVVGSLAVPTPARIDPTLSWRILGGETAPEGSHPYIVSVQLNGNKNCDGSIVSKNYVITSARCVRGTNPTNLSIKAGINKLSDSGHVYRVLTVNSHEDYDPFRKFSDVAILEVEEIDLSLPKIATIRVETEFIDGGVPLTIAGWGPTTNEGAFPNDLQQISVESVLVITCKRSLGEQSVHDTNQICTVNDDGRGVCPGDSGSPLVRRVDNQDILVGIGSWGRPSVLGNPDVFGRVSAFIPWFNDKCNNCLNSK